MTPEGKAASVHDRLLAKARSSRSDFNLLLRGALPFSLWYDMPRRPTCDADLLGLEARELGEMIAIFREICSVPCEDGMLFLKDSVHAAEVREDARYGGIRVELVGMLGNARCSVQIDIGYGDVVTPAAEFMKFRPILDDNPVAVMKAYPRETVIAEKLEAIVSLGMANSRMKDFFDLHVLVAEVANDRVHRWLTQSGKPLSGEVLHFQQRFQLGSATISPWIERNKPN